MGHKRAKREMRHDVSERVQVDLALPSNRLHAAVQGAGNYGIATTPVARETDFTRLAGALSKINPMLRDYADAKHTSEVAMQTEGEVAIEEFKTELAGMNPDEVKQRVLDIQAAQKNTEGDIDKHFRNEYSANPLASIRIQRMLGANMDADFEDFRKEKVEDFKKNFVEQAGLVPSQDEVTDFINGLPKSFMDQEDGPQLEEGSLMYQGFMTATRGQRRRDTANLHEEFGKHHKTAVAIPELGKGLQRIWQMRDAGLALGPEEAKLAAEEYATALSEWQTAVGMLNREETIEVLHQALATIPAENLHQGQDFLEEIAGKLMLGNQLLSEDLVTMHELSKSMTDRKNLWDREVTAGVDKAFKDWKGAMTQQQNTFLGVGNEEDARASIEDEISLIHAERENGGQAEFTPDQNNRLIELETQRRRIPGILEGLTAEIVEASGIHPRAVANFVDQGAQDGWLEFAKNNPDLVKNGYVTQDTKAISFDFATGAVVEGEGLLEVAGAIAQWRASGIDAEQAALAFVGTPAEKAEVYRELKVKVDLEFKSNVTKSIVQYYLRTGEEARDLSTAEAQEKVDAELAKTAEHFDLSTSSFSPGVAGARTAAGEAYASKPIFGIGPRYNPKEQEYLELRAFGVAVAARRADGTLESKAETQYDVLWNTMVRRNEESASKLIKKANSIKSRYEGPSTAFDAASQGDSRRQRYHPRSLKTEAAQEIKHKAFISKNSEEFAFTQTLVAFDPVAVQKLLDSAVHSGGTGELQHLSGFRLPSDFFATSSQVYIEGLVAGSAVTAAIAERLHVSEETLIKHHEQLKATRGQ